MCVTQKQTDKSCWFVTEQNAYVRNWGNNRTKKMYAFFHFSSCFVELGWKKKRERAAEACSVAATATATAEGPIGKQYVYCWKLHAFPFLTEIVET